MLVTAIYSRYTASVAKYDIIYGSLATIVALMFWVLHDAPIVLRAVYLLDKDFLIFAIPSSGPVFIGPVETKGEITIRIVQVALQRPF